MPNLLLCYSIFRVIMVKYFLYLAIVNISNQQVVFMSDLWFP
jgi:hypothetical protein